MTIPKKTGALHRFIFPPISRVFQTSSCCSRIWRTVKSIFQFLLSPFISVWTYLKSKVTQLPTSTCLKPPANQPPTTPPPANQPPTTPPPTTPPPATKFTPASSLPPEDNTNSCDDSDDEFFDAPDKFASDSPSPTPKAEIDQEH